MKIAITGKGGVGKTTLAGTLARLFAKDGKKVFAVDADPDANLASAIGIPLEKSKKLIPFSKMKSLARERTGAEDGYGSFFILNPKVDDLPEAYCLEHLGVKLLTMGTIELGGGGCVCAENALIKRLMQHLLIQNDEVVIMDMEAGIEHLGRGTAESVDALIVVVEPGQRSIQTAHQINALAQDIGIKRVFIVASKIKDAQDLNFIQTQLKEFTHLGFITFSDAVREADMNGSSPADTISPVIEEINVIKNELIKIFTYRV
ncbi:AAA family ATPase [Sulfurospirillum diekertiae]|uniref:AAA family ATPase n=1 Tax=Sulfurospirillum diekertiae TaxID=1854492 RepID=A0A6G9VP60_9BACT|nr:carbon monoxide dehydrogenase accessory protein CooC [Sulfurospirillum diekertiae]QIR75303.1 AAA family ATPase [Sulfurospirillum diekertiae]QIR77955.1 AAA family ATPase [Sulfurospirillum diekertiae]